MYIGDGGEPWPAIFRQRMKIQGVNGPDQPVKAALDIVNDQSGTSSSRFTHRRHRKEYNRKSPCHTGRIILAVLLYLGFRDSYWRRDLDASANAVIGVL